MHKLRLLLLLLLSAPLLASCCLARGTPGEPAPGPSILAYWPSPKELEPPMHIELEEVPSDSWPCAAFVCLPGSAPPGRIEEGDGTLYLACGPHLSVDSTILDKLAAARYAEECSEFEGPYAGRWARLAPNEEPFFLLVDWPGGTAGAQIRVFWHYYASRDPETKRQSHLFRRVLDVRARRGAYLGDVDNDGSDELIVDTEEANMSGAGPNKFRIFKEGEGGLKEVGPIEASEVYRLTGEFRLADLLAPNDVVSWYETLPRPDPRGGEQPRSPAYNHL